MGIFILYILWHKFCPPPSSGMSQICGFWWITAETSPSLERSVASWTGQTGCKALRCRCGIASSTQHGIFSSSQWWIVPHIPSVWGQSQAMLPRCRCSSFWHSACFGRVLVCQFHKEKDLWQSCTGHLVTGPAHLSWILPSRVGTLGILALLRTSVPRILSCQLIHVVSSDSSGGDGYIFSHDAGRLPGFHTHTEALVLWQLDKPSV